MSNFESAYPVIVGIEAGYSDDPKDPGNWTGGKVGVGELKGTMGGISAAAYPNEDIKNLTPERRKELFRRDYWDRCGCESLSWEKALCLFDAAVNQGQGYAHTLPTFDAVELMTQRALHYTKSANVDRYGHSWFHRLFTILKAGQKVPPP
jgi:lysozyme family protein